MPVYNITTFLPEIILALLGLGVLVLDLVLRGEQKRLLPAVTVVGLAAYGTAAGSLWNPAHVPAFEFWHSMLLDNYAVFFKVLFAVVGILVVLLATDFLRRVYAYGEFFVLLVFTLLGMSLLSGAVDLVTIYLAFELVSLSSYVLAGYLRRDPKSNEAALKYFLYGASASAVMIYGMSLLYGLGGSTNLLVLADRLAMNPVGPMHALALVMVLAGLGYKVAMAPFQAWAPDVYEGAPTAVTAFLSVGPKAAGFAILARFLLIVAPPLVPQWQVIVAVLATLTMFTGNLLAIRQQNVKRMLAYSSIAHAGYMLIGVVAAGSQLGFGMAAVLYYLVAYLLMNLGAFAVLMIVAHNTGTEELEGFRGLARGSLGLALIMLVFLVSLTGIPPTAGFVGKLYVFGAAISSGVWWWLGVVGIINSAISVYYYMNIARLMFFCEGGGETTRQPVEFSLVMWVCLVGTLVLCLVPAPILNAAAEATMLVMGR
ncbi:NADH-quinone oxidoreductase subunit N [bacterium]|nr:NADH-quinone oxidoreductase subunit N [bacterium]